MSKKSMFTINYKKNKNKNNKLYIEMIIRPYKITNPSYAYTNTTTAKQKHPYPPLKSSLK